LAEHRLQANKWLALALSRKSILWPLDDRWRVG
jgi:hypothetical protein